MADIPNMIPNVNLNPSPAEVQGVMNVVFWIILGLFVFGALAFILYRLWKFSTYIYDITILQEVGNIEVLEKDIAKKMTDDEGNYLMHYYFSNKKSRVLPDKYRKIAKSYYWFDFLRLFPQSKISYFVYMKDGKVIPMDINKNYSNVDGKLILNNVSLTGMDYDTFNFLQSQIKANITRYQKVDKLMQMLPYIALFFVVMAFILGMIFYTQHVEKLARDILGFAQQSTNQILDKAANMQIIPNAG